MREALVFYRMARGSHSDTVCSDRDLKEAMHYTLSSILMSCQFMGEDVFKIMEVVGDYVIMGVGHPGFADHNYGFEFILEKIGKHWR